MCVCVCGVCTCTWVCVWCAYMYVGGCICACVGGDSCVRLSNNYIQESLLYTMHAPLTSCDLKVGEIPSPDESCRLSSEKCPMLCC